MTKKRSICNSCDREIYGRYVDFEKGKVGSKDSVTWKV